VGTSAWVDFFRGTGHAADTVDRLIDSDEVALCGPVVTELRRGIRSRVERDRSLPLLAGCHVLEQPPHLWEEAGELGYALARKGATIKTLDLLIAIYALSHATPILTTDADFTAIARAGTGLLLARP
jgi:predicted nucleic acid-binding protein